jgi:NAD(P)-dependent dehydrogenase (short-subunit alcohol dehydrogenase family)
MMVNMVADLPQYRLGGRIAVVTGAGRGIGRACALRLAEAGAEVHAVARSPNDLDRLARESEGRVKPWVEDVTSANFVSRLAGMPALDILVNNAGSNKLQPVLDVDDQTLDSLIALNIRSAFKVAQAAARAMVRLGIKGSIINISSQMGWVGGPRRSVYCMTKHAVEGLTKAMALDMATYGIRINAVAPTIVETSMTAPFFKDPEYARQAVSMIPLGRVAQPEDVADAVLYLASAASRMVTGTSLKVDGGSTAQ